MKLEPCPFCGGTDSEENACQMAKVVLRLFKSAVNKTAFRVECGCGAHGPATVGYDAAGHAWNNRSHGQSKYDGK
jgi:Lar family restriction alleviation protein